jgi:hypothetical protein
MKKLSLIGIALLTSIASNSFSLSKGVGVKMDKDTEWEYKRPHRCPKHHKPTISYNTSSTALTVNFPAANGGKVEIYRNGSLVVSANAPAGSTLNYVLRNYGAGDYTVVVSCGNTAIYNGIYEVK